MKDKIELALFILNVVLAIFQIIREINNTIKTLIIWRREKNRKKPINWKEAYNRLNQIYWDKNKNI